MKKNLKTNHKQSQSTEMENVTYKDLEKLNLRVANIKAAKQHPNAPYYLLVLDLGQVEHDVQVVADLAESYKFEELIGKQVIFLENFDPKEVRGETSIGALLITTKDGKPVLISPEKKTLPGVKVAEVSDTVVTYHPKE